MLVFNLFFNDILIIIVVLVKVICGQLAFALQVFLKENIAVMILNVWGFAVVIRIQGFGC